MCYNPKENYYQFAFTAPLWAGKDKMREDLYRAGGISHEVFMHGETALAALAGAVDFASGISAGFLKFAQWDVDVRRKILEPILIDSGSFVDYKKK